MLGTHLVKLASHDRVLKKNLVASNEKFNDNITLLHCLSKIKPASVINCIGYKGDDPVEHFRVNGCLPRVMADWCEKHNALFVHISTNAVFPASETRKWRPADNIQPQSPYEISKAFGEDPRAYVVRASFIGRSSKKGNGLFNKLLSGEPYYDRKWNGVTALALAKHLLGIAKRYGGSLTPFLEHIYSSKITTFSEMARLLNSNSRCVEKTADARLLGGGIELPPMQEQLNKYCAFLKG